MKLTTNTNNEDITTYLRNNPKYCLIGVYSDIRFLIDYPGGSDIFTTSVTHLLPSVRRILSSRGLQNTSVFPILYRIFNTTDDTCVARLLVENSFEIRKIRKFYYSKSLSSEEKLEKYIDNHDLTHSDWVRLTRKGIFTEAFLERHIGEIDLFSLPCYQKLSYEFMERHKDDDMSWYAISIHQELSEDFMRKFSDKIEWGAAYANQKMSEAFILELCRNNNYKNKKEQEKL